MLKKAYQQQEELKHFGVLGMRWGHRQGSKPRPAEVRTSIGNAARAVGGNVAGAAKGAVTAFKEKHKSRVTTPENLVGKPVKTLFGIKTEAVYDKNGNDISSKPFARIGKEKGQSDKDFDKMIEEEMNPKPEKMVGKPVKTLFGTRTEAVYDASGKDISSKPFGRPFKKKGQSDKDYDAEIDAENSDAPIDVAKRKAADIEMNRNARISMAVALAVAGGTTVAMYLGSKGLKKAADAQLVAKYGPVMAELIRKGRP